jgi:hypothetical protein
VPEDDVLFELPVSKRGLRQVTLALTLTCRSSYRGVVEFMHDLLGVSTSVGNVHDVQQWTAQQAGALNRAQDLSGIRVGLHDEIFQGARPVLAGVGAESTYCYLLAAEAHRDGDTWGVHLLDAAQQGLAAEYTIADAGQGLRVGQKAAWGDTPCHGDVFHIQHQCETLANTLGNLARGARSWKSRSTRHTRGDAPEASRPSWGRPVGVKRRRISWPATSARGPSGSATTFCRWRGRNSSRAKRYSISSSSNCVSASRTRPVVIALQNQRDVLLAFAGVLDKKLAAIAQSAHVPEEFVRAACVLNRKPRASLAYWQGWGRLRARLRARLRGQFHAVFAAVSEAMAHTLRSSSLVENLNSRLRNYFTLRRHLVPIISTCCASS